MSSERFTVAQGEYQWSSPQTKPVLDFFQKQVGTPGSNIPPNTEVSKLFGIHHSLIGYALRKNPDLKVQVEAAKKERAKVTFAPSSETAWFLGMMMGGGRVVNASGFVFTSSDAKTLHKFKMTGERILGKQGLTRQRSPQHNPSIVFNSKPHVEALGDFRKEERSATIQHEHGWALEESHLSDFVTGVFDSGGTVVLKGNRRLIKFMTNYEEISDLYRLMLHRLGIERPQDMKATLPYRETAGIIISNIRDLQLFAEKITSTSPQKQQQLDRIRQLEIKAQPVVDVSHSAIVAEWKKLTHLCEGRSPTSTEITALYKKGKTCYSYHFYARHFGKEEGTSGRGKFDVARTRLASLIANEPNEHHLFP